MCIAYRYTLGGFYLARYSDSPAGAFEEVGLLVSVADVHAQSAARAQVFQGPSANAKPALKCCAHVQLVALAGIVWNPPLSCAWAARVYVNNRSACYLSESLLQIAPPLSAGSGKLDAATCRRKVICVCAATAMILRVRIHLQRGARPWAEALWPAIPNGYLC